MKATFVTTKTGRWAYIQKSVRVNGVPKSINVKKLGTLEQIRQREGCPDPEAWVKELAARMTAEEKEANAVVSVDFRPGKEVGFGEMPLRHGGDLLMLPVYNRLGLPELCRDIVRDTRARYDLGEILRTLVLSRILSPGSKIRTYEFAKGMINPPRFSENDMYRSLSLLAGHINDIQAGMYKASKRMIDRRERVIYFDCTNFYFEIEDNDPDRVDPETGEVTLGLRKRGKSKENRPNPIVQMGMFMDGDGIPLAFNVFPGNGSEQSWLCPLEETLGRKFDLTEFVVSTDAGLASEANRRYNMAEGRDYICVQSLPSLKEPDQKQALCRTGWRIAWCGGGAERIAMLPADDSIPGTYSLDTLIKEESRNPGLLKDITFYREIIAEKTFKILNPQWVEMERLDKGGKHKGPDGRRIPKEICLSRNERIIVTYSHDYDLYLKHKRAERLKITRAIVSSKDEKGRHSQQSPRKYIRTVHRTKDGDIATKVDMAIDDDIIKEEEKFDGFYAYGTSLDDDAIDILKARSFHHEIEHLFRTTKTFLDARPVYLSRPDRIKAHFLICFISMTILKIIQRQLTDTNPMYRDNPLSIDRLINTLRGFMFRDQMKRGYSPCYERTELTDQLQQLAGINVNTQIITPLKMRAAYRSVK